MENLPFDPETVTVQDLPDRLEEEDVDLEALHALQLADTRKGAQAVYERRVAEITEPQDSDDAAEPIPAEPASADDDDEDRARGYRITQWAGHPNYECLDCPFKYLDEARVIRHRADQH